MNKITYSTKHRRKFPVAKYMYGQWLPTALKAVKTVFRVIRLGGGGGQKLVWYEHVNEWNDEIDDNIGRLIRNWRQISNKSGETRQLSLFGRVCHVQMPRTSVVN